MTKNEITSGECIALLFLALMADMVIRAQGQTIGTAAQGMIIGQLVSTILLLLSGVFYAESFANTQVLAAFAVCIFSVSAGNVLLKTEEFCRFTNAEPLPQNIVLLLILGAALFSSGNLSTLGRTAQLTCWIFIVSICFLVFLNLNQTKLTNLQFSYSVTVGFWSTVQFPPELLLWPLLYRQVKHLSVFTKASLLAAILSVALFLVAELTLGMGAQTQPQVMHTLARIGGVSVFKRLDALHAGAWILAMIAKLSFLLYGIRKIFEIFIPKTQKKIWPVLIAVFIGTSISSLISPIWRQPVISIAVLTYGVIMLVMVKTGGRRRAF